MDPKRLYKEELIDHCRHFVTMLLQNTDAYVAFRGDKVDEDLVEVYKDFDVSRMMDDKQRQTILDVLTEKKMTKQQYLDAIYMILDDPVLFEAMMLNYDEPIDAMLETLDTFNRLDKVKLFRDKVFQARFAYIQNLMYFYQKATHLYGFVSFEEVSELIDIYENLHPFPEEGYERKRGRYKKTVFADPARRCLPVMYHQIQAGVPWVMFTTDGLMVSPIFAKEYEKEMERVLTKEGGLLDPAFTQEDYDALFDDLDDTVAYRKAYLEVIDEPLNVIAFVSSSDSFNMGKPDRLIDLKHYLLDTFMDPMTDFYDEGEAELFLQALAEQMCEQVSDHHIDLRRDLDRGIDHFKTTLEEFEIEVTKDEVLYVTMLLSLAATDQRNWLTRGFSDNELMEWDEDIDAELFADRFDIGGAEAEEVEDIDPDSGETVYRIRR